MSDFKAPIDYSNNDEMEPPTYDESIANSNFTPSQASPVLHPQLQSLVEQIKATQAQNAQTQSHHLKQSLALLTSQIDPFFASFSSTGLQKGTLYLIPRNCVSPEAKLADLDLRAMDEFVKVAEVGGEDSKGGGNAVELGYWSDEGKAKKLAMELQPKGTRSAQTSIKDQKPKKIPAPPTSTGGKSSWWGRKPKPDTSTAPLTSSTPYQTSKLELVDTKTQPTIDSSERDEKKSDVDMKVTAEEVVFRSENAFGLWSSERGYAVVMRFVVTL